MDAGKSAIVERACASEFSPRWLAYIVGTALHLGRLSVAFAAPLAHGWSTAHTALELLTDSIGHRWAR